MIKIKTKEEYFCDVCKSENMVRVYPFEVIEHDGHRNEAVIRTIEFCPKGQNKAYELQKKPS